MTAPRYSSGRTYRQRKAAEKEGWAKIRRDILAAWADGQAVTEMKIRPGDKWRAAGEYLAVPTLQNYVQHIYGELGVKNAPAAVMEGIR